MQQVVEEQDRLFHEVSVGLEAAENATKACRLPPSPLEPLHRHKMAVIVPYRDREEMLTAFLPALSSFLKAKPLSIHHLPQCLPATGRPGSTTELPLVCRPKGAISACL